MEPSQVAVFDGDIPEAHNATWQRGVVGFGDVTIENCHLTGFHEAGIVINDGGNPITSGATVRDTYVVGPKPPFTAIQIDTTAGSGKGPILIDHCTVETRDDDANGTGDGFPITLNIS